MSDGHGRGQDQEQDEGQHGYVGVPHRGRCIAAHAPEGKPSRHQASGAEQVTTQSPEDQTKPRHHHDVEQDNSGRGRGGRSGTGVGERCQSVHLEGTRMVELGIVKCLGRGGGHAHQRGMAAERVVGQKKNGGVVALGEPTISVTLPTGTGHGEDDHGQQQPPPPGRSTPGA